MRFMNKKFFLEVKIILMKTLIIFIVVSTCFFTQNDSTDQIDDELTFRCFIQPDSLPQIIGGIDSLQSRLQYPNEALEKGIEGTVYCIVTIDTIQ